MPNKPDTHISHRSCKIERIKILGLKLLEKNDITVLQNTSMIQIFVNMLHTSQSKM